MPQLKWKPPPKNVFKVNVDAAINSKSQVAGLGAVIRDSENKIVAVGIKQISMKEHVSYAEAEAIEWGLKLARRAALSTLIIESGCLEVVELVNNTKSNKTGLWWIIEEIQNQKKEKGKRKSSKHIIVCSKKESQITDTESRSRVQKTNSDDGVPLRPPPPSRS